MCITISLTDQDAWDLKYWFVSMMSFLIHLGKQLFLSIFYARYFKAGGCGKKRIDRLVIVVLSGSGCFGYANCDMINILDLVIAVSKEVRLCG